MKMDALKLIACLAFCVANVATPPVATKNVTTNNVTLYVKPKWMACFESNDRLLNDEEILLEESTSLTMEGEDAWRQRVYPRVRLVSSSENSCFVIPMNPLLLEKISAIKGLLHLKNSTSNETYFKSLSMKTPKGYSSSFYNYNGKEMKPNQVRMRKNAALIKYRMVSVQKIINLQKEIRCFDVIFFCEKLPCKVTAVKSPLQNDELCSLPEGHEEVVGHDKRKIVLCSKENCSRSERTHLIVTYFGPSWENGKYSSQKPLKISSLSKASVVSATERNAATKNVICKLFSDKCNGLCDQSCKQLAYNSEFFMCNGLEQRFMKKRHHIDFTERNFPLEFVYKAATFVKSRKLICLEFVRVREDGKKFWLIQKFMESRFSLEVECNASHIETIFIQQSHCFSYNLVQGLVKCGRIFCKEPVHVKSLQGPFRVRLR